MALAASPGAGSLPASADPSWSFLAVIGVTSFGPQCGSNTSVYTRVASFAGWLTTRVPYLTSPGSQPASVVSTAVAAATPPPPPLGTPFCSQLSASGTVACASGSAFAGACAATFVAQNAACQGVPSFSNGNGWFLYAWPEGPYGDFYWCAPRFPDS